MDKEAYPLPPHDPEWLEYLTVQPPPLPIGSSINQYPNGNYQVVILSALGQVLPLECI